MIVYVGMKFEVDECGGIVDVGVMLGKDGRGFGNIEIGFLLFGGL